MPATNVNAIQYSFIFILSRLISYVCLPGESRCHVGHIIIQNPVNSTQAPDYSGRSRKLLSLRSGISLPAISVFTETHFIEKQHFSFPKLTLLFQVRFQPLRLLFVESDPVNWFPYTVPLPRESYEFHRLSVFFERSVILYRLSYGHDRVLIAMDN